MVSPNVTLFDDTVLAENVFELLGAYFIYKESIVVKHNTFKIRMVHKN